MRLFLTAILIGVFFSAIGQTKTECQPCVNLQTKQIELGITIDQGDYAGLCYNSEMMRSIRLQTIPQFDTTRYMIIQDFSHDGDYFFALIDLDKLTSEEKVIVQLERFKPKWIAGHTQLRYQFQKGGVLLYKEMESLIRKEKPEASLTDIVTSIEAMRPYGKNYGLLKGTQDKFIVAYRMKSLHDVINKAKKNDNNSVEQYVVKFEDEANKKVLFKSFAERGNKIGYSKIYNTITYNCTNALYFLAEPLIKAKDKQVSFWGKMKIALPVFAPRTLEGSDLISQRIDDLLLYEEDNTIIANMNE